MKLIITADDYTAAECIDNGIEKAIIKGCINCVSVLVNNPVSLEKIKILHSKYPDISIGLHLTLTSGMPLSEPEQVSTLVRSSSDSRFMEVEDFDYYRINLMELENEMEKQIQAFLSTGIKLDHLSCHHGILNIFEDFFKVYMSLALKYEVPIRNPILISRQKMNGFRWSIMKREGLSKAFKLIDDVGLVRIIRTSMETKPKTIAKRMTSYSFGKIACPDFFIDTYYGKGTKCRLKRILKNITKGALSELVVHLADDSPCNNIINGINPDYIKGRQKELKNLLKVDTKKYIKAHEYMDWGKFPESKQVTENPFFHY
jgi:predicted glycoside hydrolase/deacetylase ChbG (UPF0249 family)